jgi:hypothetical protein
MAISSWQEHGNNIANNIMAISWQEHVKSMAISWQEHDIKIMARTWHKHDKSMALIT